LETLKMAILVNDDPQRVARLKRELWPTPPDIRAHLVRAALGFCGLEVQDDGQVTNIPPANGKPSVSHRNKLAAMRILTSFDRNALELQRVELAMEARGIREDVAVSYGLPPMTPEIAEQAMEMIEEETKKKKEAEALEPEPVPDWRQPPPEPEEEDRRWPITKPIREAILVSAMDLCGLRVTPEGAVESTGQTPAQPRIVLGAMRVLAGFDLLAIQQKRVKWLGVAVKVKQDRRRKFKMDPEIARTVNAFIHAERVKLRDRIDAGDEAAIAQADAAAKSQAAMRRWQ
jgi:hypothetical protein